MIFFSHTNLKPNPLANIAMILRKIFSKKDKNLLKQIDDLEKSKEELKKVIYKNLELTETSAEMTRAFSEKTKNYGINRFDNILNTQLHLYIVQADLTLFFERIRLSDRRFEKLLCARMLCLILAEYLKDFNSLIGKKFINELKENKYHKYITRIQAIHKELSNVRKQHEKMLIPARNQTSAHKNEDALLLINNMYSLDTTLIYNISFEVYNINRKLDKILIEIYYLILKEADKRKKHSK
ncbi:hypothetical protein ACXGQW_00805 [Wenyingzhuangia sp. IMCC45533]